MDRKVKGSRSVIGILWWGLGGFAILLNILSARPAHSHSSSLDIWGCHSDQRGYHCHEGQFAGQQFESKMEMLRAEPGKKVADKTATEKKDPTIWEIDAKIEKHFRRLEEEREEEKIQSRKENTAKQAPDTKELKQDAEDSFPFLLVVQRNEVQLYTSHDEHSKVIRIVKKGEELDPISQTVGLGEVWYRVKTAEGNIGWVKVPGW